MDSFTRCYKSTLFNLARLWVLGFALLLPLAAAYGQSVTEITQFRLERTDDEVLLSSQLQFELPGAV
jgi:hypothetical protein